MIVKIGKFRKWWGSYQLTDLLKHVGVSEDTCHKLGEKLSKTFVQDICEWIDKHKKRKVKIKLHNYDTWNLDGTLAYLLVPALKQYKGQDIGYGRVDDDDVPEELRSYNAPPKEHEYDMDDFAEARWNYVLDEMIWAWEQIHPDCDWEDQYHSGEIDFIWEDCDDNKDLHELKTGSNNTHVFDKEGWDKHQERIDNGLRLFGKYLQGLWN